MTDRAGKARVDAGVRDQGPGTLGLEPGEACGGWAANASWKGGQRERKLDLENLAAGRGHRAGEASGQRAEGPARRRSKSRPARQVQQKV